jgi:hypothetical protein
MDRMSTASDLQENWQMRYVFSFLVVVAVALGYGEMVGAQGRGAGAASRLGAPVAVPAKPTLPAQAGSTRPQGPPSVADRAGQGRGRSQTPPVESTQTRGRGRSASTRPDDAGRASANAADDRPIWARERRPPTAGELVAHNPQLAARLQALLPGVDLQEASKGFSNLGQFVAAVHASNNLDIPFDQLKTKMVGEQLSLGAAIRALRPDADADEATQQAQTQARTTMRDVRDN